jgi:hypothetical protein
MNIINNPLHIISESDHIVSNPDCIGCSKTDDCIICLTNNPECIKFKGACKCSPLIHQVCLDKWFATNPLMCPICKKKYTDTKSGQQSIQNRELQNRELQNKKNDEIAACCLCGFIMLGILCGVLGSA